MAKVGPLQTPLLEKSSVKQWISRAFIISILVYLVVIGYLIAEAVMGASKWGPYGVNIPTFIALIVGSEILITATTVWIFREDAGIWPASISEGRADVRAGHVAQGLKKIVVGAWDISIVDLRLRTPRAILYGRINRIAALAPLAYALIASVDGAPWGLRSSALLDIGLTLAVWAFMEVAMVRPDQASAEARVPGPVIAPNGKVPLPAATPAIETLRRESYHEVRRVQIADIDRILEIERIRWRDQAATREMILSRLSAFPEGQLGAIHVNTVNGRIVRKKFVAWATVMPADRHALRALGSWEQVTSSGTIQNVDRKGDALVGVNLTSVTEGATYILLGEILASVVEWGKKELIGGSRLNGFASFNERRASEGNAPFTADQYAHLREIRGFRLNEQQIDLGMAPLSDASYTKTALQARPDLASVSAETAAPDYVCSNLRGYMGIPGAQMIGVIPDYFADPASADYGVLIEWANPLPVPLRYLGVAKRWLSARVRSDVRAELDARQRQMRERSRRSRATEQVPEFLRRPEAAGIESTGVQEELEVPSR